MDHMIVKNLHRLQVVKEEDV
jgi:hypothetical protein